MSEPEFENIFQFKKALQQVKNNRSKILSLNAHEVRIKNLDVSIAQIHNSYCTR